MNTLPIDTLLPDKEVALPDAVQALRKATHEAAALEAAAKTAVPADDDSGDWYEP
jgi:hypothetical protein